MSITSRDSLKQRVAALLEVLPSTLETLKLSHDRGMALLWQTEGSITPQSIIDELGTDAAELFTVSESLKQFIQTLDPDWVPTPRPFEITINPDGTATVGDPVPIATDL